MTAPPEVSVIIPTYNRSHCIGTAVESVLSQGGIDPASIEIIVVDDGSTDGTEEVLKGYIERGSVTYLKQANGGPAAARNCGIRNSKGQYITFLDADDVLYPNSIEARLSIYAKYSQLGLLFTDNKKIIRKNGKEITYRENDLRQINFIEEIARDYIRSHENDFYLFSKDIFHELVLRCFIWTGTVMTRRTVLEDVGYFDEQLRIAEDHDLWLRICLKYEIGFRALSTAVYVLHDSGITKNAPLYYESSIKVRSRYLRGMHRLPGQTRKELRKQIGSYFFAKGYHYYENNSYRAARRDFLSALRYDPLTLNHYLYPAATFLPVPAVQRIRSVREWLSSVARGPGEAHC
jgi:glycosyltransferase involved in cell wall biosynthesis